jgi:hypothetical protein
MIFLLISLNGSSDNALPYGIPAACEAGIISLSLKEGKVEGGTYLEFQSEITDKQLIALW